MSVQEIDKSTIESYLVKICKDKIFADSPRYMGLLQFVVSESLSGKHIKELNIAAQIYGDNFGEDKSDGRVRVYMFNLRKRLDSYYKGAGSGDEVIFILEKGSYNMQFKRREATASEPSVERSERRGVKWLFFVAGVVLTAVIMTLSNSTKIYGDLYCWEQFVKNDKPTLCVLADQVVIQHKDGDNWINGVTINDVKNRTQFYNYMMQNPGDSLRLSNYTIYSKAIPYSLHRLTEWMISYDKRFSLTPDSSFTYEDISGKNIIYLGQIKTMDVSSRLFLKDSKIFSVDQKSIYVQRESGKKRYRAKFDNNEMLMTEYAIVSYMPLEGSAKALFFASNHDVGTMATLSRFTDKEFLEEFYALLPSSDCHFNALFKVEGIGRTTITCELIELEVLAN